MTGILIGDELHIEQIIGNSAQGYKQQAEVSREDGGEQPITFGGDPNSRVEFILPVEQVMTRDEKKELQRAWNHYRKHQLVDLFYKYGTCDMAAIRSIVYKRMIATPRNQKIRLTKYGYSLAGLSARLGGRHAS